MRKSKLIIKAVIILLIAFILVTCDSMFPSGTLHEKYMFDEEYWGEWIRMDTGDTWYFGSNYRTVNGHSSSSLDKDMSITRQSQNVVKVTEGKDANIKEYFLYASRIRNSTFEATALKDDTSRGMRSGFTPPIGAKVVVSNPKLGGKDSYTSSVGDLGKIIAEKIIAGDNYLVTIDDYEFTVTPNTDGEDVGTLTLTQGVNMTTSIVPQSSSTDLMRLYSGNSYDLILKFTNIGETISTAMEFNLIMPPSLEITKNENSNSQLRLTQGDLQSFMPGQTREVKITVKCNNITEDYEFMDIAINTEDFYGKTWDDSVSLKVNKEKVTFNIRSNRPINGVVIVPNGKTYHFKTSGWSNVYSEAVDVPKYNMKDYLVVFSGASTETEAKYSFAVDKIPASDFNEHGISELKKYWPNDTEQLAKDIKSDDEVMAYLLANQANYYKVKFNK